MRRNILTLTPFFFKVIDNHIADDPMNEDTRWLQLTRQEIASLLKRARINVSHNSVENLCN